MALEQEIQARQQDVTDAQQIAGQLAALAPDVPQALSLAGQFGAVLGTFAPQLAALEANLSNLPSAQQASASAGFDTRNIGAAIAGIAMRSISFSTSARGIVHS